MGKIIEVKNVSVKYITGDLRNIGLKEFVMKKLTHQYRAEEFLAVNDVSFSLENGDMLGIIGTNGAGKSTLMNHLIGQKIAITSNKPQTTRNRIQSLQAGSTATST